MQNSESSTNIHARALELSQYSQSELISLILSNEYKMNSKEIASMLNSNEINNSDTSMITSSNSNAVESHKHKHSDSEPNSGDSNVINQNTIQFSHNQETFNPKKKSRLKDKDIETLENKQSLVNNSKMDDHSSHSIKIMQLQAELRARKPFDFSKYSQRHVALKFSYIGSEYNGFASQIHNEKTVEAELFRALQLTCLIESRELSHYSRCGRTDKGVSAAGQVIALYLRSKVNKGLGVVEPEHLTAERKLRDVKINKIAKEELNEEDNNLLEKAIETCPTWIDKLETDQNPEVDEYDYVAMLNKVLPPSIRILSWQPVPLTFSARFSCTHRVYKYYFFRDSMNLELMNQAAQQLVGSHDFRNFCKIDAANSVHFIRKLEYIHIKPHYSAGNSNNNTIESHPDQWGEIEVRGNAFLYHQVRCMAAILFYIGRGVEKPSIITDLLNIEKYPRKPVYDIASELPLVLFDTIFPNIQPTAPLSAPTIPFTVQSPAYPNRKQALINQQLLFIELHSQWRQASLKAKVLESIMKQAEYNLIQMRKLWVDLNQILPIPTANTTHKVAESNNNTENKSNNILSYQLNLEENSGHYLRALQLTPISRTFDFQSHTPLNKRRTEKSYEEMKEMLTGKKLQRNQKLEVMSVHYRGEFLKKATRLDRNNNNLDPSHNNNNNTNISNEGNSASSSDINMNSD